VSNEIERIDTVVMPSLCGKPRQHDLGCLLYSVEDPDGAHGQA
jgi:hypothetical protein